MIILFDLDGTLIESTEAITSTFHHAFEVHGEKNPTDREIQELIGYPLDIMFSRLGVEESRVWDFVDTYKQKYRTISKIKTELLPQAKEAVELASSFAELGIVTTKTGLYSQELMEHFGMMQHFEVLIGREHVQNPKPHEEPILTALKTFECENKEIWMIGDTKLDLLCAQNAGVNSIGVLSGYDTHETLKKFTDVIHKDALEAVEYLKKRKI
ncbi:MAG: HAD family hydrolase [Campylobacterota bacterium]|nr:HAD family hydrolase [Campylobacterota bacterium]